MKKAYLLAGVSLLAMTVAGCDNGRDELVRENNTVIVETNEATTPRLEDVNTTQPQ